jgi:hypothetical protein
MISYCSMIGSGQPCVMLIVGRTRMRYIAIKPEDLRAIHWTKVSVNTFVSGSAESGVDGICN